MGWGGERLWAKAVVHSSPPFFTLSWRTPCLLMQAYPNTSLLWASCRKPCIFMAVGLFDQMCSQIGFWRGDKTSTGSGTNMYHGKGLTIFSSSVGALLPLFLVLRWVSQHSYPLSTGMYSQPCDAHTAVSAHGLFYQVVKHVTKLTWSRGASVCFHLDQHLNEYRQLGQQEGAL